MSTGTDVCVIGAGVTGLAASWHLKRTGKEAKINVVLLEKSDHAGGHARTVDVRLKSEDRTEQVDVGFMVFNRQNYPNLVGLFEELQVEEVDTDMSFSVSLDGGSFEWSSSSLNSLFACRWNILRPSFYGMLRDMIRFNKEAPKLLQLDDEDPRKAVCVGEYIKANGYGKHFVEDYLLPMTAALWSSTGVDVLDFSALTLVSFLHNHSMLQIFRRPQWKTVAKRSKMYTEKIAEVLGESLELNNGAVKIYKNKSGLWSVEDTRGKTRDFHQVIFACHADEALALLGDSAADFERADLGEFRFAENVAYLHSDAALMPRRHATWSSWNYIGNRGNWKEGRSSGKPVFITYWLNKLQNLKCEENVFISLNPHRLPSKEKTHAVFQMSHPQFTPEAERSQRQVAAYNGSRGLWFCGAYMGYGFHEDGLRSGLEAACGINTTCLPWAKGKKLYSEQPRKAAVEEALKGGSSQGGIFYRIFVGLFFHIVLSFLRRSVKVGRLVFVCPDNVEYAVGESNPRSDQSVRVRVFDWWFFIRVALEYDLGLASSFIAGEWAVERDTKYADGLRQLFLLLVANRDSNRSRMSYSGLVTSWIGYSLNFVRYKLRLDNSLANSRGNIRAHYDLSNDMFASFLDRDLLMYSSALYETQVGPPESLSAGDNVNVKVIGYSASGEPHRAIAFKGTLEAAQLRKVDMLLARARLRKDHVLLDIGFGWGGVAIRAAKTIGCRVHGITLSSEQKVLAEEKVKAEGLDHLITFELIDYRRFARSHQSNFDRIISCEMIEAVGHNYLPDFFEAIERLLKPDGIFVMEAITTPESRYEEYLKSTDFINTVIFPGSCCPSLTALTTAMAFASTLVLEEVQNISLHYSRTLEEWRYRFNDNFGQVRRGGFDDAFRRCWNYYFCYCEAGFFSRTEGCLVLTFARPGNTDLAA